MCLTRRGAFCVRACVVCLVCQGFGSGTPSPRISVKCRSQEKASILLQNQWRRRALPALICGVLLEVKKFRKPSSGIFFSTGNIFFFLRLQPSHLKDIWSFSTSQSPLKPGPERRWIHQEAAFPLQISTKISCYYKRALDSAAPLHSSFINRGIASALRSSQPTRDRQNTANLEKEDEQKWWKRRRCCLEGWSWLRNKSFVESSSMFSSLSRLRLEQPTEWMSCNSNPWLLRDSKCWVHLKKKMQNLWKPKSMSEWEIWV